jgi:Uma2 family endonuclease
MSTGTLISVDEYLRTSYSPDREYVDGELVEIHVGEWPHSIVQRNIIVALTTKYPGVFAVPEIRSHTRATRYRLPDVAVVLKSPGTPVLQDAPFIAIEILSSEDRVTRLIEKLNEYAAKGTRHIWVFDPRLKQMFTFRNNALQEVLGDTIATDEPRIELTRAEIFQDLD